jgi:hypothetical protein
MELRVHNEVEAIPTPTGYIPKYEDLKKLFKEVLGRSYEKADYIKQFTIRVPKTSPKSNASPNSTKKTSPTTLWNSSDCYICNANGYWLLKLNTAIIFLLNSSKKRTRLDQKMANSKSFFSFFWDSFLKTSLLTRDS